MAENTKKRSRRSKQKHAALDPQYNLKSRQDLIDYDYLSKLSEKEKDWLSRFTEEYINASFDTKNPRKNLHKTKKLRQECYNRNNARNRDILTKAKAMGKLDPINIEPERLKEEIEDLDNEQED